MPAIEVRQDSVGTRRRTLVAAGDIQVLHRAVSLLQILAEHRELSLSEITEKGGLHKSTAHRILATLEAEGLVRRNQEKGTYLLGLRLMMLGAAATRAISLRDVARPHLERLAESTRCVTHLATVDRDVVVYLDKVEREGSFRLYSQVGRVAPVHCTALGKVLAASLPPAERRRLVARLQLTRYTPRTITDPDVLLAHLERVDRQGYALDDGEFEEVVHCVAAPVRNHQAQVVAAISATAVQAELPKERREQMIRLVTAAASAISDALGSRSGS